MMMGYFYGPFKGPYLTGAYVKEPQQVDVKYAESQFQMLMCDERLV